MKKVVCCTLYCFLLTLVSCSSSVKTKVNTFRLDGVTLGQGTIKVIPSNDTQTSSLEYAFYSTHLAKVLQGLGYSLVASDAPSEFTAALHYSVNEVESGTGGLLHGLFYSNHKNHYTGLGLRPSVVVVEEGDRRPVFERNFQLIIARTKLQGIEAQRVYEVTGVSRGRCGTLSVVFEEMLQAMVTQFPANNGSLNSVTVTGDTRC